MITFNPKVRITAAACYSHKGKKRPNNEDNLFFEGFRMNSDNQGTDQVLSYDRKRLDHLTDKTVFYAAFDGMGGGDYGELASYTAADEAYRFFHGGGVDAHDVTISLEHFCNIANQSVYSAGQNLGSRVMGTTIVGCYFYDGRVWICNVGDSRCYRLRNHSMEQLSLDHTDEKEMMINGITGRKPYLTQYLGIDPEEMHIEPYVQSHDLESGDRYLLCSDGLTDMVSLDEIQRILENSSNPKSLVQELTEAALVGGGKDNITVMVVQC